jgi:hypothetical protein
MLHAGVASGEVLCPAERSSKKSSAQLNGFMEAFVYSEWSVNEAPKLATQAPIGWNDFVLTAK